MITSDNLENFTNQELNTILKNLEQMFIIPIENIYNLSKEQLKEMQKQIKNELQKRRL